MQVRNLGGGGACKWRPPNPLDSRFRGNDGAKIGSNSAIIASLRPLRLRAFASNSLCQHALAIRNQAPRPADGSLLPWEKARMRVSRAPSPRRAAIKPAIRNQAPRPADVSLLPSREKARMRVSRAPSPRRRQSSPPPKTKRRAQPPDPFSLSTPSFPRKRESRRSQPSPPPETKRRAQPADPFSLHGLTGVGLRPWERGRPARRAALTRGAPSS